MGRTALMTVLLVSALARAEGEDAGVVEAPAPRPDAGVIVVEPADAGPPVLGWDMVQTLWGPGRKNSGEAFKSTAKPVDEGPLRWRWKDFSLALGGQYLARGELRADRDFNKDVGDSSVGVDQRARFSVRASAKDIFGVLVEFQDVRGWGSEPNTVTVTPNTGLHQGFVDIKAASWLDVRVGRQELSYGEERLIGILDWGQAARAFDGIFVRVSPSSAVSLDAFTMMLTPPAFLTSTAGNRFHNSGSYFGGVYGRARFGKAGFDLYTLGLFEDPSSVNAGFLHDNNRLTIGLRAFATFGGLALVAEGDLQTGKTQADNTILAGATAVKATWTFNGVWGSPYIMGEFSAASGDGDTSDGVDSNFNQLFPTGHIHLGYMDYVGWQNVIAGRGSIGIRPWRAHFWIDVHHFAAWDPRGAWYAANGSVFRAADPSRTQNTLGTEVDFSATVPIIANVAIAGNFSFFVPASGTTSTWGFLSVRSQF